MRDGWYRVSVSWRGTGHFRDLRIWLMDNVRDHMYVLDGVDLNDYEKRVVCFARKQDAVLFALRWS